MCPVRGNLTGACGREKNGCPLHNLWGTLGCPNLIQVVTDYQTTANFEPWEEICSRFVVYYVFEYMSKNSLPIDHSVGSTQTFLSHTGELILCIALCLSPTSDKKNTNNIQVMNTKLIKQLVSDKYVCIYKNMCCDDVHLHVGYINNKSGKLRLMSIIWVSYDNDLKSVPHT